ncbi:MAG: cation transporter [Desulfamplus sp.]|nr:cation transporter [Desulfamplus sp.]
MEVDETKKKIEKLTWAGLLANVLLALFKLVIGLKSGSQAVVADAMHSFSDTASDIVILLGVRYWTAPPDHCHPYGHQKMESFVTIIIGLSLLTVAGGIAYNAIVSLSLPLTETQLGRAALLAPVLSIIVKETLFHITFRAGREIRSSSLKANAWHHRSDALSSIPVLVAVGASVINPSFAFLDSVGAVIVSIFIINVGFKIVWESVGELMDRGISRQEVSRLRTMIENIPNVKGVHDIRSRKLAGSVYIDLHLEVDGSLSIRHGHAISETVKEELLGKNPWIVDVMVHLEPDDNSLLSA